MIPDDKWLMMAREHYQDLLREAEHDRLVQAAMPRKSGSALYARALSWLGSRLVNWGCALEERYANTSCAGALQPAHEAR